MLRLKAERRSLAKVSGASVAKSSRDIGVSHSRPNGANINVGASRPARFAHRHPAITVAAGLAILSAGILAAGPIANHLPDIILGLCIVILGMLFGVLLAVRA